MKSQEEIIREAEEKAKLDKEKKAEEGKAINYLAQKEALKLRRKECSDWWAKLGDDRTGRNGRIIQAEANREMKNYEKWVKEKKKTEEITKNLSSWYFLEVTGKEAWDGLTKHECEKKENGVWVRDYEEELKLRTKN